MFVYPPLYNQMKKWKIIVPIVGQFIFRDVLFRRTQREATISSCNMKPVKWV